MMTGRAIPNLAVAGLCCLVLAACGFTPLYAEREAETGGAGDGLAALEVAPIPDRLGQLVRNQLLDRIAPGGGAAPVHRLLVELDVEREGVGFGLDEAITRTNLGYTARYRLVSLAEEKKVVFASTSQARVSFDMVQSDFANLSAERDAEGRAAAILGAAIAEDVALFLRTANN